MKKFDLVINNKHYIVEIENIGYQSAEVIVNGTEFQVAINRDIKRDEDNIPKIVSHIEETGPRFLLPMLPLLKAVQPALAA